MLARYYNAQEIKIASENGFLSRVDTLSWGLNHLDPTPTFTQSPKRTLMAYAQDYVERSDAFYTPQSQSDVVFKNGRVQFDSPVVTPHLENNRVHGRMYEAGNKDHAILILPNWNAEGAIYDYVARSLRWFGLSSLRMSLPYHDLRRPGYMDIADHMVSANLGRTIRSMRQAVLDARVAIAWLKEQGYKKIGLIGVSLGAHVGSIVAAHDPMVDAACLHLNGCNMSDVAWHGIASRHIRKGLQNRIELAELRKIWSLVSADTYCHKFKGRNFPLFTISGYYDAAVLPKLTRDWLETCRSHGMDVTHRIYWCGHYTLASFPFFWMSLYQTGQFLKRHLSP